MIGFTLYTVVMSFSLVLPWCFHHRLVWEGRARHSRRDCANCGGWFQGMGSNPQVQPCCPLLWIVFPVGLESFWDLQLGVSTVGMGLAVFQWSLNLWGESSCAELCCSTSCEERCADSSNKNRRPPLRGITEGHIGIFLSPIFSHKPGTLFMDEHMVLKALHLDSVSVDMNVQLCFDPKSKCDTFCGFRASFWFTCGLVYVFFVFWF